MVRVQAAGLGAALVIVLATAAAAEESGKGAGSLAVRLTGFREVPAIVTRGKGSAFFQVVGTTVRYDLRYEQLEGQVQQAHIHVGQDGVNGGIAVFLCSNLGNGPTGTPACPPSPGRVQGVIEAGDVVGPAAQGVAAGEFKDLLKAVAAGTVYVNVHSDLFPTGEIRGDVGRQPHP
jgi:CHRD domain